MVVKAVLHKGSFYYLKWICKLVSMKRGAQINTFNSFNKNNLSYSAEAEATENLTLSAKTRFFHQNAKNILSKITSPDLPMSFSLNPYNGCEHGCVYCYARNSHEYWGFSAGVDFESKIMVKLNAPDLLKKEFDKPTWKPTPIEISGNTDCYQPAEKHYEITRKLLEVCLQYRNPVGIITKNALITRDIDILKQLAHHQLVHVYISVTGINEQIRLALEPRTVTYSQRLLTIKKLTEAGIPVGVMAAPVIPGLNDHEIPAILKAAAENGAVTAGYTVVRLNGAVAEIFEDWINKTLPDKAMKVLNQIKACHGGTLNDSRWGKRITGQGIWAHQIEQLFKIYKTKYFEGRAMPPYRTDLFLKKGLQLHLW